jgi:membrane glycosyltransferase
MVLFARGLRGVSRIHLLLGIFGYLCSPLWLLFLLTFNWALWSKAQTGLSQITVHAFTPFIHLSGTGHALLLFIICMSVIFLPKFLAVLDLVRDSKRRRAFGGLRHAVASAFAETVFSALHAPLQMLWHSKFIATILLGIGVHWGPQNRGADGISWSQALRQHWGHTLIGLVWGSLVWWLDPFTFWWFVPVITGMVLSIPLSVFTSRRGWGNWVRRAGLFLTPEETMPSDELATLRARMANAEYAKKAAPVRDASAIIEAVLDPYVNAIHVSLLREKHLHPEHHDAFARFCAGKPAARTLAEKWLAEGQGALKPDEQLLVLQDPDTMSWLHRQSWLRPRDTLAASWQDAIQRYAR